MEQENMTIKSNFARTCNRFSQFLKERRSHGDIIDFGSIASPKLDMNGDAYNNYPTRIQTKLDDVNELISVDNKKSLELFPLTNSYSTLNLQESTQNVVDSSELPKSSNMTIIYEGKVVIIEDVEEDKAREIMCLASKGEVIAEQHDALPCNNTMTNHVSHSLLDLPIARRASLHRFMEKRKERIAAYEPYQLKNSSSTKEFYNKRELYEDEEEQLKLKL